MQALIFFLSFFAFFGVLYSVLLLGSGYARRLHVMRGSYSDYQRRRVFGPFAWMKPFLGDMAALLGKTGVFRAWADREGPRYSEMLRKAGDPACLTPEEYLAAKVVSPVFFFLLSLVLLPAEYRELSVAFLLMGMVVPITWLGDRVKQRSSAIRRELPEAMDTMALVMGAGLSLDRAMDLYIDDTQRKPLMEEFSLLRSEMRVGKVRGEVLLRMGQRLGLVEVMNLATAVIQSEKTGVSLAEFMAAQAAELREKQFFAAEEQAQQAPVKILLPLILFVMPCVFLVLLGPMIVNQFAGK